MGGLTLGKAIAQSLALNPDAWVDDYGDLKHRSGKVSIYVMPPRRWWQRAKVQCRPPLGWADRALVFDAVRVWRREQEEQRLSQATAEALEALGFGNP